MKMKLFLTSILLLLVLIPNKILAQTQQKPNILFIAVDDLKPMLGCYGDKTIKTPNIDRIANNGTIFMANYVQQAVCGPTRASLMTGMRPDYTKVWDLKTKMRDKNPDIVSIPQYFSTYGYTTQGVGKIYDIRCVDEEFDKPSWTVPYYDTDPSYYSKITGPPAISYYQNPETKRLAEISLKEAYAKGLTGAEAETDALVRMVKPSIESSDVPDNAYTDGAHALMAKDILINLSKKPNEPFFFAVGFSKPHLPFVAPKKYWDMYKREDMKIAKFQQPSKDGVAIAYHNASELRSYTDIPALETFTDQEKEKPGLLLAIDKQKELIHGYHAAVSYSDAQIGLVLKTLDSLGLTKNTIIVLWGDHGWHLGDHNLWCKHTNFEQATHAPLLISVPWLAPSTVKSPTEFVDIFPTLCELSNLPIPTYLDGKSLVTTMKNPTIPTKAYAVSQYPRSSITGEYGRLGHAEAKFMGYSLRDERYRYTIWLKDNYKSFKPFNTDLVVGVELYDYKKDPDETKNVAHVKKYAPITEKMNAEMLAYLAAEFEKNKVN